ncbi:putative integral membrane protein [Theileria parva strain Muguga]|uniref:putative integral membrane protein n=1 Tax=Theileria parva strain Muguga TaxID=333668 RepID=UPI001C6180C2|nr:putative integral membrane protein [Theileria parva strain Muguga]KAF5153161.1 putative integral membrane protein [Theileria parva strain Muguga]
MMTFVRMVALSGFQSGKGSTRISNLIWFLLGILTSFGHIIFFHSFTVFTGMVQLSISEVLYFVLNIKVFSLIFYALGFITAFILFPVSLFMLQVSLFGGFLGSLSTIFPLIVAVKSPELMPNIGVKILLYITSGASCCFFGAIKMISIGSVTDPFVLGNPSTKMLFFLLGHPVGDFLATIIAPVAAFSSIFRVLNNFTTESIVFFTYKLTIIFLLVLIISLLILSSTNYRDREHRVWMKTNVIRQRQKLFSSIQLLVHHFPYVMLSLIVLFANGLFSLFSVMYAIDVNELYNPMAKSFVIVFLRDSFDFLGKCLQHLIKFDANSLTLQSTDSENYLEPNFDISGRANDRVNAGECSRKKLLTPLSVACLLAFFQVLIVLLMFLETRFGKMPLKSFLFRYNVGIFLTIIMSAIKGFVISHIYTRLLNDPAVNAHTATNAVNSNTNINTDNTNNTIDAIITDHSVDRDDVVGNSLNDDRIISSFLTCSFGLLQLIPLAFWTFMDLNVILSFINISNNTTLTN